MHTKLVLLSSFLGLSLVLSACGLAPASTTTTSPTRSISVSGVGTVYLTPDIATLNVGVHTEEEDISVAVENNNLQAQALMDALVSVGVASADIKTSNFSVWTREDYNQEGSLYNRYVVDNTVFITVRDLGQLSSLLNIVVAAGANNINGLTFDVTDKTSAQSQAREQAMANAKTLAEELARIAGIAVGQVLNITYSDYSYTPYYGMGGGAAAPEASVPIQPGQTQISVTVNVTYGIE